MNVGERRAKSQRGFLAGEGISFVISLISVSALCIFIGYLLGQYALQWLNNPFTPVNQAQIDALNDSIDQQLADMSQSNSQADTSEHVDEVPGTAPPSSQFSGLYRVQAGVFSQLSNAQALVSLLREKGFEAMVSTGPPYRVQTGAFSSFENAQNYADQLREKGFEAVVISP